MSDTLEEREDQMATTDTNQNPTVWHDCCKGYDHAPWCFEAVKVVARSDIPQHEFKPYGLYCQTCGADDTAPQHQTATTTHQPAARSGGDDQSQLFPRYSFAVVTGRYKILDNRSDGPVRITQIATADGEDEARLIVNALNQHQTLVAERDRAVHTLRAAIHAMRSYQHGNSSPDLADEIEQLAKTVTEQRSTSE